MPNIKFVVLGNPENFHRNLSEGDQEICTSVNFSKNSVFKLFLS